MKNDTSQHLSLAAGHKYIQAEIDLPGSKSIANRVLPLAALAHGVSIIHNLPDVGEDVQLMLAALRQLGVKLEKISSAVNGCSSYRIYGCSGRLPVTNAELFLGNSGTSLRFLTAILSLLPGSYSLTGIERMKQRPIIDLIHALRQLGCEIKCLESDGYPPLQTQPFHDQGVTQIELSGKISSQYLTGVLLALPLLQREVKVRIKDELISKPYVTITLAVLELFGVKVSETEPNLFTLAAAQQLTAVEYSVEPDASSASYFLALAALNGQVTVTNLSASSLQGDKNFAHVLAQMGAQVSYMTDRIKVTRGQLEAIEIDMTDMPDVAMTIAVLALFARGTTIIRGIASWKVKETDRLAAMATELTKVGASVSYDLDSIRITPPATVSSNMAIDTYNDHRMAMCFSLLAAAGVPVIINDHQCVAKTFANYFSVFKQIVY